MSPNELPELLNLPSSNPVAFTQVDKSVGTLTKKPRLYIAMHARVQPPADQVITTDFKSNLVREFEKFQLRKSHSQAASTQLFGRSISKRLMALPHDQRQNKVPRLYG